MNILLGVAAFSLAVLGYAWALGLSRSPAGPAWVKTQWFATTVCLLVVWMVPTGVYYVAVGLTQPLGGMLMADLAATAVASVLLVFGAPRLARRGQAPAANVVPMPMPPVTPAPSAPMGKLAA